MHLVWVASKRLSDSESNEKALPPAVMHAFLFLLIPVNGKVLNILLPGETIGSSKVIGPTSRDGSTLVVISDTPRVNWLLLMN